MKLRSGVLLACRLVHEQSRRLDLGDHVRELALDRLELRDRLAERAALLGVLQRLIERPLREAHAHRGDADAPDVEDVQELLEPRPARPQQVLRGDAAIGERQRARVARVPAHLAVGLALLVAGRAVGDDQVGNLLCAAGLFAGDGRDAHHTGDLRAGVGDELLRAINHPFAAVLARAGARIARVAARLGLGQPERAQALA